MIQTMKKYQPKNFSHLKGLQGITDEVFEIHFKLYEGYVNRTNSLTEHLATLDREKRASGADPVYAEMTRRLGYEYNGMILHELYFGNLKPGGREAAPQSNLKTALEKNFDSYQLWLDDFKATERSKYVEAFLSNINWEAVEKRLLH